MFEAFHLHGKHSTGSSSWRDWLAAAPETSFDPGTGRRPGIAVRYQPQPLRYIPLSHTSRTPPLSHDISRSREGDTAPATYSLDHSAHPRPPSPPCPSKTTLRSSVRPFCPEEPIRCAHVLTNLFHSPAYNMAPLRRPSICRRPRVPGSHYQALRPALYPDILDLTTQQPDLSPWYSP